MEIIKLLTQVMEEAGAVRKTERNTHQNFNFRGIDSVVNAVSPALRKHGVVVVPTLNDCIYETVTVGQNRTQMGHVRVNVTYTFFAPDGSSVASTVSAESMDSGDKATAKAMSVAFRTALLQTLCLPTDDADPDTFTYERTTVKDVVAKHVASQPAQTAPAKPAVKLGSKALPAPERIAPTAAVKPSGQKNNSAKGTATDNQIKMMATVAKQIEADDSLLHDLAGTKRLEDMSSAEASSLITKLLAIKQGNATLSYDTNGKAIVDIGEAN